jgi:1-acyl-sn-glycerol-3-phosphate acyltransferase
VSWGEATAYDMNADRKAIARAAEKSVRGMTAAALRKPSSVLEAPADKIAAIQASTELREAF